ncbi:MAG: 2-C-methyl-D-erythritol 4-phosphate cytidylyltransferase [Candidatus Omnitrophota bacterium]
MQKKVVAIILAAGEGRRLKSDRPKIFVNIEDKPILLFSLAALSHHPFINEIILVSNRKTIQAVSTFVKKFKFFKVKYIILGGPTRKDSVANGLKFVEADKNKIILVHDAARPFIEGRLVTRLIKDAFKFKAAIPAVPVKATIKSAKYKNNILYVGKTLPRQNLWEVQTPQAFRSDLLKEAYFRLGDLSVTDDAQLLEKLGIKPKIVLGSYSNIKITTFEDLIFAKELAKKFKFSK